MAGLILRDPAAAQGRAYDLIVVGGGIYGVALTLEASRRGFKTLLLEKGDFGQATSWNSLRIVHGGLRYLQALDFSRFRESVEERRWFFRNFPDFVQPLPCLMPLYSRGLRRPSVLRLALAANDFMSRHRNSGVLPDRYLPRGEVLNARETIERFPGVDARGLRGAALWYDGHMPDSQRLLIEMLRWAAACGASVLNYTEATALCAKNGRVSGVRGKDQESGRELQFDAGLVVNCCGPWARSLAESFDRDVPHLFHYSLAFNVLLDRDPLSDCALAVEPRRPGSQTYFLHPWKGRILAGTYHAGLPEGHVPKKVDEELVLRFLKDLNHAIPGFEIRRDDVKRVHWGFLPATAPGALDLAVREVIHDHGREGGPKGLFSVSGVKFTMGRRVAEKTLRAAYGDRLRPYSGPGRPDAESVPPALEFLSLLQRNPDEAVRCVRHIVEAESVLNLDDLMLRRTDWGMIPEVGSQISGPVSRICGWSQA